MSVLCGHLSFCSATAYAAAASVRGFKTYSFEDRVRGVDFDERYVIAPEIGEVLEHALGVGLVQLGAFHYGVAQHQATIAGKINIDHFDVGIDEPDVVLPRQFTTNATIATLAFASAGLLHPHVPFDEAANLTLGVATAHHAPDELAMLLLRLAVLLGPE